MDTQAQRLFKTGRRFSGTYKPCGKCGYGGLNINIDIIGQDGTVLCVACWNMAYCLPANDNITEAWLADYYGIDLPINPTT